MWTQRTTYFLSAITLQILEPHLMQWHDRSPQSWIYRFGHPYFSRAYFFCQTNSYNFWKGVDRCGVKFNLQQHDFLKNIFSRYFTCTERQRGPASWYRWYRLAQMPGTDVFHVFIDLDPVTINSSQACEIPSGLELRPIDRRALLAMISSCLQPWYGVLSPSMISCSLVSVKIVIPLTFRIKRRFLDTSTCVLARSVHHFDNRNLRPKVQRSLTKFDTDNPHTNDHKAFLGLHSWPRCHH